MLRGVRGATTVEQNTQSEILRAAAELVQTMIQINKIDTDDIGAVIFSSTPDLTCGFPAAGVRTILGWTDVPLFGTQEIENPNGLHLCIRVLILWNTSKSQKEIQHTYLHRAIGLR